jgi:hypothetical protein
MFVQHKGYIRIDRSLMSEPDYFSEKFTRIHAWLDMLLLAEYQDSVIYVRGIRVEVPRGSLAISEGTLCERWRWSRNKVRAYLAELTAAGEIVQQNSRVINRISVVNYDDYQAKGITESTTEFEKVLQNEQQKVQQNSDATALLTIANKFLQEKKVQQKSEQKVQQTAIPPYTPSIFLNKDNEGTSVKPEETPTKKIIEMYHATCKSFPRLQKITQARVLKIRLRWLEMGRSIETMQKVFDNMESSNFLRGDNRRGWKASFDWIMENDKNWVKVAEGNYANRESNVRPQDINSLWK